MNYEESRQYIRDAQQYGSVLGLDNIRELMSRLGNPQDSLKFVHVAGTNGKGSVIAYLYSVLREAGYRTGRYISPTIYTYRERMECAGAVVTREKFAEYVTRIERAIRSMTADGLPHPTPFEIETAAAFLYFAEENCDLVLLETGLGGSKDATNIIKTTELAILVSISMDHMGFLGNTLAEIAEKKAGIIKPGCAALTVSQKPEAQAEIEKACETYGVSLTVAEGEEAETLCETIEGQSFLYKGEAYRLPLLGKGQKENAVAALCALDLLEKRGYPTTLEQRKAGFLHTRWEGRFTVIRKRPLFIVDGAHNPGAAKQLAQSVRAYLGDRRIYYIMGMFRDKDYREVIRETCPLAEKIVTIEAFDEQRAMKAGELAEAVRECNPNVEAAESLADAVERVMALAGPEDAVLAFGSLSFLGAMTEEVKNYKGAAK